jgi:hypothetical protein
MAWAILRHRRFSLAAAAATLSIAMSASSLAKADDPDSARVTDLIFPPGSLWASLPVVKWDHRVTVLIAVDPTVTPAEIGSIREVAGNLASISIADLALVRIDGGNLSVSRQIRSSEFVVVVGKSAIEAAAGRYEDILLDVVPSRSDGQDAVRSTIDKHQPGLTRYRFDYSDGKLRRAVTFIDTNGSPDRLAGVLSVSLLFSFAPSLSSVPPPMPLLQRTSTGHRSISPAGYDFLRLLYSSRIPSGISRDALNDNLGR